MGDEEALLRAIVSRPEEASHTWLVLADWLDEHGRTEEAELIRLRHAPTGPTDGPPGRLVELLTAGVRPCVPTFTNLAGMRFVWVPPGSFRMGSPETESGREGDEPRHPVTLTRGFWLAATPVTQAQWRWAGMPDGFHFIGDDLPAQDVTWAACMEFCQRLGRLDGHAYRLPTEAEWEYACRAGTQSPFFWGDIISTDLVNHDGNYTYGRGTRGAYRERPVPAGSLPPNVFGLHEMHGNVWEWCLDWYAEYMGPATDPTGPVEGTSHVLRGGSWYAVPAACRSAKRASNATDGPAGRVGCRVVVALPGGLP